ncbi:serine/threonine protein kinase [bacterium]|nr:MAG: serine/threonine protein kinase [bacterium]
MPLTTPFAGLSPDVVLDAVEALGLRADGRLFELNSYENRVYRVGLDEPRQVDDPRVVRDAVVVKFYRAGRWSDAQILEEHAFGLELQAAEVPVAAPMAIDGATLHAHHGFRLALFECRRGGSPELDQPGARALLGRTLARLHAVGGRHEFAVRPRYATPGAGGRAVEAVLATGALDMETGPAYERIAFELAQAIDDRLDAVGPVRRLRLHGDCHLGNLLWDGAGPVFVDLDDCASGAAVQDLWMLIAGDAARQQAEWTELLEGYEQFANFDFREVELIEPLRALRMMNHAAWLATRWDDPAFPRAFPWFGGRRYWEGHVADLREQLALIDDPPLLRRS